MPKQSKVPSDIGRSKSISNEDKWKNKKRSNVEQHSRYNYRNEGTDHSARNAHHRRTINIENTSSWKVYRLPKDNPNHYDADVSSSFTSIFSCTYADKSSLTDDNVGKIQNTKVAKYPHVLKFERFNRRPVVPVPPCRNVSHSAMKLRQQARTNLKVKFFSDINRKQQAREARDDTNKVHHRHHHHHRRHHHHQQRRRHEKRREFKGKQPEMMTNTTAMMRPNNIATQTDIPSIVTEMVNSTTTNHPHSGHGDGLTLDKKSLIMKPFRVIANKVKMQLISISFLWWTLLMTILSRTKSLLYPVPMLIGIFLWTFVTVVLVYIEINTNCGQHFEMFYQYLTNLLTSLYRRWF